MRPLAVGKSSLISLRSAMDGMADQSAIPKRLWYVVGPEQPVSPPDTQCLTPGTTLQKLQDLRS